MVDDLEAVLLLLGSGYLSSLNIGWLLRHDGMPAMLAYAAGAGYHVLALGMLVDVLARADGVRRGAGRAGLLALTVLVAAVAAVGFQQRTGATNPLLLLCAGLLVAAGPAVTAARPGAA